MDQVYNHTFKNLSPALWEWVYKVTNIDVSIGGDTSLNQTLPLVPKRNTISVLNNL